jgi:hypothetical protein
MVDRLQTGPTVACFSASATCILRMASGRAGP